VRSGPSGVARHVHFGLGAVTQLDSLTVDWPDGRHQAVYDVEVDQSLIVRRTAGGGGEEEIPEITNLLAPYPNPFNPLTTVAFDLAQAGRARLEIFDVRGRKVISLHDGELPAARHEFRWDGLDGRSRAVAAGVYLVRFEAEGKVQHRQMTLVR